MPNFGWTEAARVFPAATHSSCIRRMVACALVFDSSPTPARADNTIAARARAARSCIGFFMVVSFSPSFSLGASARPVEAERLGEEDGHLPARDRAVGAVGAAAAAPRDS